MPRVLNPRERDVFEAQRLKKDCVKMQVDPTIKRLAEAYYDWPSVQHFQEIIDSIIAAHLVNGNGATLCKSGTGLNEEISHAKQIGEDSVAGVALLTDFRRIADSVVIKAPRENVVDELAHEYYVAVEGTNYLRKVLPNFCYAYAAFSCLPPVLANKASGKAVKICGSTGKEVTHLLMETVNGPTARSVFSDPNTTVKEMHAVFLQVGLALERAWHEMRFRHNDLHSGNCLLRNCPENSALRYSTHNGKLVYVYCPRVATIIDLGRSAITRNGVTTACGENYGCQYNLNNEDEVGHWSWDLLRFAAGCMHGVLQLPQSAERAAFIKDWSTIFEAHIMSAIPGETEKEYVSRLVRNLFTPTAVPFPPLAVTEFKKSLTMEDCIKAVRYTEVVRPDLPPGHHMLQQLQMNTRLHEMSEQYSVNIKVL